MLDWLFLGVNRYLTSNSRRLARAGGFAPHRLVRRVAEAKLVRTLRHVWTGSPHQRRRWQDAGITRRDLRSARVLPRIPFCDPGELARDPEAFVCVRPEEITDMILTSGTSGQAKKIYFTSEDLNRQARMIGAHLRRLPGASRVLVIFSVGLQPASSPALIAKRGVEMAGMFGLISAAHAPVPTLIDLIREYRTDTLISTPTRVHQMTLETDTDPRTLGVRYLLLSSEPWTEELRVLLEDAWGAKTLDVYAANECACGIASECVHQNGLHLAEIDFWIEIVDPDTGEPVEEGEEGEIVITTLSRRGMPLVRYRIGDLARLLPVTGRCACGMSLRKLSRIRGRADKMVILGGGFNVYPDEFDEAILAVPGVTDYQLVLEKDGYKDVLNLDVETDLRGKELTETMIRALRTVRNVGIKAESFTGLVFGRMHSVPHGSLSAGRNKTVRVVDNRQ